MAVLEEVYKKGKERGFLVLAVNVYQDRDTVSDFTKELGLTYPVLLDEKGEVATAYEVFAIPVAVEENKPWTICRGFVVRTTNAPIMGSAVART